MYNEKMKRRVLSKLENSLRIYEKLIFTEVGQLRDVRSLYTHEHFRSVPDSVTEPITNGTVWGDEWGSLWVKGSFEITDELDGKPLYALSECGGVEQLFFINGVPKGIFNSKNREHIGGVHCSQYIGCFKKGECIELAFECYAGHYDPDTDPYNNYLEPDGSQTFSHCYNGVKISPAR